MSNGQYLTYVKWQRKRLPKTSRKCIVFGLMCRMRSNRYLVRCAIGFAFGAIRSETLEIIIVRRTKVLHNLPFVVRKQRARVLSPSVRISIIQNASIVIPYYFKLNMRSILDECLLRMKIWEFHAMATTSFQTANKTIAETRTSSVEQKVRYERKFIICICNRVFRAGESLAHWIRVSGSKYLPETTTRKVRHIFTLL